MPDFDFDFYGVTGGVDYRLDNGMILGASVGYTWFGADLSKGAGEAESDAYTFQGFGTFDVIENLYFDITVGYTLTDFDQTRIVDLSGIGNLGRQALKGSPDISQFSTSAALNYRPYAGRGWTFTPYGSIFYSYTDVDSFAESGGSLALRYKGYTFDSILTSLGARVTKAINLAKGVLTPFLDIAYQHENGNDSFQIETAFLQSVAAVGPSVFIGDPDRDFATLGGGRPGCSLREIRCSSGQVHNLAIPARPCTPSTQVGGLNFSGRIKKICAAKV